MTRHDVRPSVVQSQGRTLRFRLAVAGASCAAVASVLVGAGPAAANYPPPPEGSGRVGVKAYADEVAPTSCTGWDSSARVPVSLSVAQVCAQATAAAPTTEARRALMYAFKYQGAAYSQWNRDSLNPPMFDCSSMIGRAYRAAGAKIKRYASGEVMNFYPYFGWTGAYTTDAYQGTNLMRLAADAPMVAGDIIIQFNGSNPANSAGNAGHAQMYLGTIGGSRLVIHSSGGGLKVVKYGNGWFSNEWHFRYKSLTTPLTAADRVDSQVTPWKYETYTAPAKTVLHKRLQVTPEDGRVVFLQRFLPYWKRWINYSQSVTGDSGIVPFDIPMFQGRMSWRLVAPATPYSKAATGPAAVFIGS